MYRVMWDRHLMELTVLGWIFERLFSFHSCRLGLWEGAAEPFLPRLLATFLSHNIITFEAWVMMLWRGCLVSPLSPRPLFAPTPQPPPVSDVYHLSGPFRFLSSREMEQEVWSIHLCIERGRGRLLRLTNYWHWSLQFVLPWIKAFNNLLRSLIVRSQVTWEEKTCCKLNPKRIEDVWLSDPLSRNGQRESPHSMLPTIQCLPPSLLPPPPLPVLLFQPTDRHFVSFIFQPRSLK